MGKKSKKLNETLDLQVLAANEDTDEQNNTSKKILSNSEITDKNSADSMNTKKKKRKREIAEVINETSVEAAIIDERIQAATILEVKKKKKKRNSTHEEELHTEKTGFEDVGIEIIKDESDVPKKKKKKSDNELDISTTLDVKKKKKKRHPTHEEELHIEKTGIENVGNDIIEDESKILKKKKKKNKGTSLVDENKDKIDQINQESIDKVTKISKKKSNLLDGELVAEEKSIENNPKVTKSQKKKKTGTAVLNAEESQVTEEDIDKFCDELDEEDNKQYEDWVKLIESSLPPLRKNS